jgi:hypothetical protein
LKTTPNAPLGSARLKTASACGALWPIMYSENTRDTSAIAHKAARHNIQKPVEVIFVFHVSGVGNCCIIVHLVPTYPTLVAP